MALSIIVHGVTTGFDTSEKNYPTFIQNFYNRSKDENYFIVEILRDVTGFKSCYTLYISRNVSNSGNRPGSYFAISLIYDDYVCLDVKAISSALETTFRNAIVGTVLKKQEEGYRYLVGNFAALKPHIDDALNKLYGQIFNVLQGRQQIDSSFRLLSGQLSKWNPTDLKDSEINEIIRQEGGIKLSNEYPSLAHKRKLEEERRQRQLEAETARRKLEEQKALAERILAEERERGKRELIKITDEANANIERIRKENEANIRTLEERTSKEIDSLKSEIAAKDTVIREYNQEYMKLAGVITELNHRIGDSQCSTYQTFSVEINRLTEGVKRSYQSYGEDIKRLSADVESLRQRVDSIKSGGTGPFPPPYPPKPQPIPKKLIIGIFGVLVALIVTVLLFANSGNGEPPIPDDENVYYAYASTRDGVGFSINEFKGAKYKGTYIGPDKEQPSNPARYNWELIPQEDAQPTQEDGADDTEKQIKEDVAKMWLDEITKNAPKLYIDISKDGKVISLLPYPDYKEDSIVKNFIGNLNNEKFAISINSSSERIYIKREGNGLSFRLNNDRCINIKNKCNIEIKYDFGTFKRNGEYTSSSFEINKEYNGNN